MDESGDTRPWPNEQPMQIALPVLESGEQRRRQSVGGFLAWPSLSVWRVANGSSLSCGAAKQAPREVFSLRRRPAAIFGELLRTRLLEQSGEALEGPDGNEVQREVGSEVKIRQCQQRRP